MFTEEDKQYLSNQNFSLALEKFYNGLYYKEKNGRNGTLTQAYPFSNEQLNKLFKHLNPQNSRVLTVGSSGDQMLYCLYYGAKDITIIDGNLYAKPWIEYKLNAIKELSFKEFNDYFLKSSESSELNPFSQEVFKKVFHHLSEDSKSFWGQIYLYSTSSQEIYSTLISRCDSNLDRVFSVFYKEKNSYDKLQNILKKNNYELTFINEEFSNFPKSITGKFDVILLSNIFRYVDDATYHRTINYLFNNNLNPNGQIQLHYENTNVLGKKSPKFIAMFPNKKIDGYNFKNRHYTYIMHKPRNYKNASNEESSELCAD